MKPQLVFLPAVSCLALGASAAEPFKTQYPTTVTKSFSRTTTSKAPRSLATDGTRGTTVTIRTVTQLEPWHSSPDPSYYPYTLEQTAITDRREIAIQGGTSSVVTSTTQTVTSTWIIWDTAATDLPVGKPLPPCQGGCVPPVIKQAQACMEANLETACHSQCKIRDVEGHLVWWCHKRNGNDTSEVALGRVCSGGAGYYVQLGEPCDHGDHRADCPPCAQERVGLERIRYGT